MPRPRSSPAKATRATGRAHDQAQSRESPELGKAPLVRSSTVLPDFLPNRSYPPQIASAFVASAAWNAPDGGQIGVGSPYRMKAGSLNRSGMAFAAWHSGPAQVSSYSRNLASRWSAIFQR